jgi:hypothetical protein
VTSHDDGHHAAGPSRPGSVILDLGPGTGALVLYTGPDLAGAEIQISPQALPARRTHAQVRQRHGQPRDRSDAHIRYAAVFPALPAGRYTIWHDADTPAGTLTITGGQVTERHWPLPTGRGQPPCRATDRTLLNDTRDSPHER